MLLAAFPASVEFELRAVICFKTPKGSVHNTTSPIKQKKNQEIYWIFVDTILEFESIPVIVLVCPATRGLKTLTSILSPL